MDAPAESASCESCGRVARLQFRSPAVIFRCPACGTRFLAPGFEPRATGEALDEGRRVEALAELRRDSARRILGHLAGLGLARGRLLDVGCSYGWFLDEAGRSGWETLGIDPDEYCVRQAREAGLPAMRGWFPEDLPAGRRFDVITFNDVFEHLAHPRATLRTCRDLLERGGAVVLNLPSNRGPLFRLAEALGRVGVAGPLARMYQLNFKSPHFYYFGPGGIAAIAGSCGFEVVSRHRLSALPLGSIRARVTMDRSQAGWRSALQVAVAGALALALRWLPVSDIEVFYLRPKGDSAPRPPLMSGH
jgi:SAM-dependent methyltransferase